MTNIKSFILIDSLTVGEGHTTTLVYLPYLYLRYLSDLPLSMQV